MRFVVANVVIKRARSDEFLTVHGWAPVAREAMVFQSSLAALDYCCQKRLDHAVIVIRFREPRLNIELHPFAAKTFEAAGEAVWSSA